MTQLFDPAVAVDVHLGPEGAPTIVQGALNGQLSPLAWWIAELDWWRQPVAREYWKVLVRTWPGDGELLCELFHDLHLDGWFLERVWD